MKRFVQIILAVVLIQLCLIPSASSAIIDVMIVFDSTAKTWVADNGGMTAFANDTVARLNAAAANSNLNLTFRLVHKAEASYTYSKNLSTDLTNLQAGSGSLSAVHQWRDTYGADIVVMMVDTGSESGWVGQGYLLESYDGDPDYAYSVNGIRAVAISHTLTHEIGHNLGCDHSKTQKDSPGPNSKLNSYSAGWYFTGTDDEKYHTIMAYDDDGYGNSYTEAPLFSTPLWKYKEAFAGHAADGDNARTIRETMDVVAAYRVAVQQPLYGSFTGAGIWQWTGSGWTQLTPDNPESIVAAGTNLYGKFANGIWQWTGTGWTHLTPDR
ncbi:MAG: M12 family metallo-peptidase, partial [Smithellaceae bacterium]|nr:M12 family metallo-peptidase [Smithellaceae bacterium]